MTLLIVMVLPDLHLGFDKVRTQPAWRDLHPMAAKTHSVIATHLTFFVEAKDISQIDPRYCHERELLLLRLHREPGVMYRTINIAD